MAVAFDAASVGTGKDVTSVTVSHVTSGSDRVMYSGVLTNINMGAGTPTSVKYNATDLSSLGGDDDTVVRAEMWRLIAPDTGTNNNVCTFGSSARVIFGTVTFTGAHQTTPDGGLTTATGDSQAPSISVPSASDEIVLDAVVRQSGAAFPVVDASQDERYNDRTDDTSNDASGGGSTEGGAASVSMDWTWSDADRRWAHIGLSVAPAGAAAAGFVARHPAAVRSALVAR